MRDSTSVTCREPFSSAARALCDLVEAVRADQWSLPALGEWDIRALVGHTSRALSTVEAYLDDHSTQPAIIDPVEYFLAILVESSDGRARASIDKEVAERGRKAGEELGEHPCQVVRDLAERVTALVESTPDDATLTTPAGVMPLSGYLPTRTFELTVHCLDLARALHVDPPPALSAGIAVSCELAGRLAARRSRAADLLLLVTGRSGVPSGISIL